MGERLLTTEVKREEGQGWFLSFTLLNCRARLFCEDSGQELPVASCSVRSDALCY